MLPFDDRLRLLLLACVLAGPLALPATARAELVSPIDATPEQKREATGRFAVGKQALEAKDYEKAISNLQASLGIVDSPNSHLELARALRDSGRPGDAWREFGRATETATRLAPKEERYLKTADAALYERKDVERSLALVVVTVARAPAEATLRVGGRVVPPEEWNAPLVASPGPVDVVLADGDGAELARRTVNGIVGQTVSVSVERAPAATPVGKGADASNDDLSPTAVYVDKPPEAPPTPGSALRPMAYLAAGIGVAGLATFAVFGLMANATYSDLKSACPRGCPADKRSEIDSGTMQQNAANVGLVVGLVGLAAGTTMFLLSAPPSAAPNTRTALVVAPMYEGAYLGLRGAL